MHQLLNPFAEIDPDTKEPYAYIPPGLGPPNNDNEAYYQHQPLFPVDTNTPIKEDLKSEARNF